MGTTIRRFVVRDLDCFVGHLHGASSKRRACEDAGNTDWTYVRAGCVGSAPYLPPAVACMRATSALQASSC